MSIAETHLALLFCHGTLEKQDLCVYVCIPVCLGVWQEFLTRSNVQVAGIHLWPAQTMQTSPEQPDMRTLAQNTGLTPSFSLLDKSGVQPLESCTGYTDAFINLNSGLLACSSWHTAPKSRNQSHLLIWQGVGIIKELI